MLRFLANQMGRKVACSQVSYFFAQRRGITHHGNNTASRISQHDPAVLSQAARLQGLRSQSDPEDEVAEPATLRPRAGVEIFLCFGYVFGWFDFRHITQVARRLNIQTNKIDRTLRVFWVLRVVVLGGVAWCGEVRHRVSCIVDCGWIHTTLSQLFLRTVIILLIGWCSDISLFPCCCSPRKERCAECRVPE